MSSGTSRDQKLWKSGNREPFPRLLRESRQFCGRVEKRSRAPENTIGAIAVTRNALMTSIAKSCTALEWKNRMCSWHQQKSKIVVDMLPGLQRDTNTQTHHPNPRSLTLNPETPLPSHKLHARVSVGKKRLEPDRQQRICRRDCVGTHLEKVHPNKAKKG